MTQLPQAISPDFELKFLKRNALCSCAIGMMLGSSLAYEYNRPIVENYGGIGLGIAILVTLTVFVFMLTTLVRLLSALPSAKHFFWNGNCQDEYLNYLSHKATKYCANAAIAVGMVLYMFADEL